MLVVGFPELPGIPVDKHPEAYDDYQYLVVSFDKTSKVNKVVYKHFKNVLFFHFDEEGKIVHCYAIDPPVRSVGWRQCSNQELFLNR